MPTGISSNQSSSAAGVDDDDREKDDEVVGDLTPLLSLLFLQFYSNYLSLKIVFFKTLPFSFGMAGSN